MNKTRLEDTTTEVAQRLKSQFAPSYLTLASIIQGVALSTLVFRVEATNTDFNAVAWLLTITTFLVILDIWHEYLMTVLAYVWLPNLLDSIVPFAFVAAELFLAHFVYGSMRVWLLAYSGCYLAGIAAWFLKNAQVHWLSGDENRDVHTLLASQDRFRGVLAVTLAVLSFLAWALYDPLHLEQVQFLVALVAFIGCVLFMCSSQFLSGTSSSTMQWVNLWRNHERTRNGKQSCYISLNGDQRCSVKNGILPHLLFLMISSLFPAVSIL